MLHIDTPLLYILSSHLVSCIYSSSGKYNDSLNDAKVATDLQPLLIKAIMGGKIPEKKKKKKKKNNNNNNNNKTKQKTSFYRDDIYYLTVQFLIPLNLTLSENSLCIYSRLSNAS